MIEESEIEVPKLIEAPQGYTNFDHTAPDDFAEKIKADCDEYFFPHYAWNFYGRIWYHEGFFIEEVVVYGVPRATYKSRDLDELIAHVNEKYGSD